jgi:tetratricopeptide (TPR) repeat protein
MAHDVFISYSSKDKATADAVCAALEAHGVRCWIAPRDVMGGVPYGEALIDGINASRLFLLVFSAHSNSSSQVMREVERAASKGIAIIPFRIDDVLPSKNMEFFLSTPHWLDALTPPLEKHLEHLVETVRLLLARFDNQPAPETEAQKTEPKKADSAIKARDDVARKRKRRIIARVAAGAAVLCALAMSAFIYTGKVAGDAFAEGVDLYDARRYREAIPFFDRALRYNGRFSKAYFYRGRAYGNLNDPQRALEDFNQFILLEPRNTEAFYGRAVTHTNLSYTYKANTLEDLRETQAAIDDYSKALELDSKYLMAYIKRGLAYGHQGNHKRAFEDFNSALDLDPHNAQAVMNRGNARRGLRDSEGAMADFNKAIELDPGYMWPYMNRGWLRRDQNDLSGAIADFNRALIIAPDFASAYGERALVFLRQGRDDEARRDFAQCFRLDDRLRSQYEALKEDELSRRNKSQPER